MIDKRNIRAITLYLDEPEVIMDFVDSISLRIPNENEDDEEINIETLTKAINMIGVPEHNWDCASVKGKKEVIRYVNVMTLFKLLSLSNMAESPKTYNHLNEVIDNGDAMLELTMREFMIVMNWFSIAKQEGYTDESSPVYQKLFG